MSQIFQRKKDEHDFEIHIPGKEELEREITNFTKSIGYTTNQSLINKRNDLVLLANDLGKHLEELCGAIKPEKRNLRLTTAKQIMAQIDSTWKKIKIVND